MIYSKVLFAASLVAAGMVSGEVVAGPVAPGFNSSNLPANDDGSSGVVSPGFNLDYFGTTYSSFYVNNNGNLTFNAPLSQYTPFGIGSGYVGDPIIAPFFADVDTRGAGSGIVTWGNGTYAGHMAFGVTYPSVGYYGFQTDKLNTFQVILTDRGDTGAGNFDIYFNYDQIQWETGNASGGSDGLGGTSAAAGFSNGTGLTGTFYQLPGSLVNGALIDGGVNSLAGHSNDGVTGQYLFQVRNGVVIAMPEPMSWTLMLIGFGGLGLSLRDKRKAKATSA